MASREELFVKRMAAYRDTHDHTYVDPSEVEWATLYTKGSAPWLVADPHMPYLVLTLEGKQVLQAWAPKAVGRPRYTCKERADAIRARLVKQATEAAQLYGNGWLDELRSDIAGIEL